jgi:hypothetical protein
MLVASARRDCLALPVMQPVSGPVPEILEEAGEPVRAQADLDAVLPNVHSLDDELDDARLLGREELLPERIEADQSLPDLAFRNTAVMLTSSPPGADDDLGRREELTHLRHHHGLNLPRRDAADRAGVAPLLQDGGRDVVAVEPPTLPGVGRAWRSRPAQRAVP